MNRASVPQLALAVLVLSIWLLGSGWQTTQASPGCNGLAPTVNGTASADILIGTPGQDVIAGHGGNDIVLGFGGDDVICGGASDDLIDGGSGDDVILGEAGNDVLAGSSGADELKGGLGADICFSGADIDKATSCEVSDLPTPQTSLATILPTNSLIARITGTMNIAGDVYVEYRRMDGGDTFRSQAIPSNGTGYELHAVRLRAATTYEYRVFGENAEGETSAGVGGTFTTAPLPLGLWDASFSVVSGAPTSDLTLMEFGDLPFPRFRGIVAIDGEGHIVWYYDTTDDHGVAPLAQKANNNIVYMAEESGSTGFALIEITPLGEIVDIVEQTVCETNRGPWHHELHLLSDSEVMFLTHDIQDPFNDPERLQEGDSISIWDQTSGEVTDVWSVFDFLDPATDRTFASNSMGGAQWSGCSGEEPAQDWTHGNSAKRGSDGSVLYSSRHLNQIISIAPDFQSLNWRLGGPNSDFTFPDPRDKFYHQHAAWPLPNGNVLLFDNGNFRPPMEGWQYSRALELELDLETMDARKVWEYRHTPDLFAACCSNAIRLDKGNTLLLFGAESTDLCCHTFTIVEADSEGNPVWVVEETSRFNPVQYRVYPANSIMGESILP